MRTIIAVFIFLIALTSLAVSEDLPWFLAPGSTPPPATTPAPPAAAPSIPVVVPTTTATPEITPLISTPETSTLVPSIEVKTTPPVTPEVLSATPEALPAATREALPSATPEASPFTIFEEVPVVSSPESSSLSSAEPVAAEEPKKIIEYPIASKKAIESYFKRSKKLPDKIKAAIKSGKAKIGMNSEALSLIYGEPNRTIERQIKKDHLEVWAIAGKWENTGILIGLKNGKVVAVDTNAKLSDAEKMMHSLR